MRCGVHMGQPFCTPVRVPYNGAWQGDRMGGGAITPFPMPTEPGGMTFGWFLRAVAVGVTVSLSTQFILSLIRRK